MSPLRKKGEDLSIAITNANPICYEVFETIGFTEILPISKARRHFSVKGLEPLGAGEKERAIEWIKR